MLTPNRIAFLALALAATALSAADIDNHPGRQLFEQTCAACHVVDRFNVGPSLVEISKLYPDNPQGIVEWSIEPGKKRPNTIQMPPMGFLGAEKLGEIAEYMLLMAEGKEEVQQQEEETLATDEARPRMQRVFMPDAGPAAIAVAMHNEVNYCWDAGSCHLRYAWSGDFIDPRPVFRGNGNGLARILGDRFYAAPAVRPLRIEGVESPPDYLGYRMISGYPEFRYKLGGATVRQLVTPSGSPGELLSTYQLEDNDREVALVFGTNTGATYSSTAGTWRDGILYLTPRQAAAFTVTITAE